MQTDTLEQCAQACYEAFVEGVRPFAPPYLTEMQPTWEHLAPSMKGAWYKVVEAALAAASKGGSA